MNLHEPLVLASDNIFRCLEMQHEVIPRSFHTGQSFVISKLIRPWANKHNSLRIGKVLIWMTTQQGHAQWTARYGANFHVKCRCM